MSSDQYPDLNLRRIIDSIFLDRDALRLSAGIDVFFSVIMETRIGGPFSLKLQREKLHSGPSI